MKEKKEKEQRLGQEDNLPSTRWQLLGDTVRFRFWDLLLVSVLTLVFYLPVLGWLIFCSLSDLLDFNNIPSMLMTYGIAIVFLMIAGLGMGAIGSGAGRNLEHLALCRVIHQHIRALGDAIAEPAEIRRILLAGSPTGEVAIGNLINVLDNA